MAQNGFSPLAAIPAAKVTPCCSAMPTSKTRVGKTLAIVLTPVPDGIAAVTATTLGSASASIVRAWPNIPV